MFQPFINKNKPVICHQQITRLLKAVFELITLIARPPATLNDGKKSIL
ncbi:MAG: hypothetical protein ACI9LM_001644 [Alteromonadaceae bacterium]|jgi:hypothetical protein